MTLSNSASTSTLDSKMYKVPNSLVQSRSLLWDALDAICPLRLAGSWDNVGPLIDPPSSSSQGPSLDAPSLNFDRTGERIFFTIDLTPTVFEEALEWGASLIYAYHPPLFSGVKSWRQHDPMNCMMMRAIQNQIAIYSPHSALDAVKGGLCDWLVRPFTCLKSTLSTDSLIHIESRPIEADPLSVEEGAGRILVLSDGVPFSQILDTLQNHLHLPYFRIAASSSIQQEDRLIKKIALCPGAGGSLFRKLDEIDLFFTGEMSHHDILDRVRKDQAVILTEHTRNERGFLKEYAPFLQDQLKKHSFDVEVYVSQIDDDPLSVWCG